MKYTSLPFVKIVVVPGERTLLCEGDSKINEGNKLLQPLFFRAASRFRAMGN